MNFGIALRRCITQRNGPWARVTLPTAPDKHTISAGKGCKTAQVAAAVTLPLHRIAFRPVSLGQRARILSLRKMPARHSDSVHETVGKPELSDLPEHPADSLRPSLELHSLTAWLFRSPTHWQSTASTRMSCQTTDGWPQIPRAQNSPPMALIFVLPSSVDL